MKPKNDHQNSVLIKNKTSAVRFKKDSLENEDRVRRIFEHLNEVIVIAQDEKVKYCNPQIIELTGYSIEEIYSMNFIEFIHPHDRGKVAEEYHARLTGNKPKNKYSTRLLTKKGLVKFVSVSSSVIQWDGKPATVVMIVDITKQKKAEADLIKSKERYSLAVEGSEAGIWDWDMVNGHFYFSDQLQRLLGYSPGEFHDSLEDIWKRMHPDDIEATQLDFEQNLKKQKPHHRTIVRMRTKNGEFRWYQVSAKAVWDESGKPMRIAGSIIDIQDKKLSEKELIASEEHFRWLMEQSPLAMEILSPDGKITKVNSAWKKLWKVNDKEAAEVIDKYNMLTDPQIERLGVRDQVREAFNGKHTILPPIQYDTGQTVDDFDIEVLEHFRSPWIQCHLNCVKDANGKIDYIVNTYVDITDLRKSEEEIRQAYDDIKVLKDQLQGEGEYLRQEIKLEHNFENIIGHSEALKYVLNRVEKVAPTDSPALIMGETGTGKELVARAIHQLSPRSNRAIVKVNCAALPSELIESELFGHEKGAYTGAVTSQVGRFELANGSTLFLDEIGELPLKLQVKLLRVLESGEFERLGSSRTLHSDARIIAATNRELEEEVRKGNFREDLWYRIKVFPITMPPLRDRPKDIPLLVQSFLNELTRKMGKPMPKIAVHTMQMLQKNRWPGNVRELKHSIESALINAEDNKLIFELPKIANSEHTVFKSFEEMEHDYLLRVLKAKQWRIGGANGAASALDLHVNTLHGKMNKLGIKKPLPR